MSSTIETPDWSKLPAPVDDGAARHLVGMQMPPVALRATTGKWIELAAVAGLVVVYAYPRTGQPGIENPEGWDSIPGARGCTPQTCSFRDHFEEMKKLGVNGLFGLSTQDPEYQGEAAKRLQLPFPLLSDEELKLTRTLKLPTFETSGMTLLKRCTLVLFQGRIEHIFYPVFPPDQSANDVMEWLSKRVSGSPVKVEPDTHQQS